MNNNKIVLIIKNTLHGKFFFIITLCFYGAFLTTSDKELNQRKRPLSLSQKADEEFERRSKMMHSKINNSDFFETVHSVLPLQKISSSQIRDMSDNLEYLRRKNLISKHRYFSCMKELTAYQIKLDQKNMSAEGLRTRQSFLSPIDGFDRESDFAGSYIIVFKK